MSPFLAPSIARVLQTAPGMGKALAWRAKLSKALESFESFENLESFGLLRFDNGLVHLRCLTQCAVHYRAEPFWREEPLERKAEQRPDITTASSFREKVPPFVTRNKATKAILS